MGDSSHSFLGGQSVTIAGSPLSILRAKQWLEECSQDKVLTLDQAARASILDAECNRVSKNKTSKKGNKRRTKGAQRKQKRAIKLSSNNSRSNGSRNNNKEAGSAQKSVLRSLKNPRGTRRQRPASAAGRVQSNRPSSAQARKWSSLTTVECAPRLDRGVDPTAYRKSRERFADCDLTDIFDETVDLLLNLDAIGLCEKARAAAQKKQSENAVFGGLGDSGPGNNAKIVGGKTWRGGKLECWGRDATTIGAVKDLRSKRITKSIEAVRELRLDVERNGRKKHKKKLGLRKQAKSYEAKRQLMQVNEQRRIAPHLERNPRRQAELEELEARRIEFLDKTSQALNEKYERFDRVMQQEERRDARERDHVQDPKIDIMKDSGAVQNPTQAWDEEYANNFVQSEREADQPETASNDMAGSYGGEDIESRMSEISVATDTSAYIYNSPEEARFARQSLSEESSTYSDRVDHFHRVEEADVKSAPELMQAQHELERVLTLEHESSERKIVEQGSGEKAKDEPAIKTTPPDVVSNFNGDVPKNHEDRHPSSDRTSRLHIDTGARDQQTASQSEKGSAQGELVSKQPSPPSSPSLRVAASPVERSTFRADSGNPSQGMFASENLFADIETPHSISRLEVGPESPMSHCVPSDLFGGFDLDGGASSSLDITASLSQEASRETTQTSSQSQGQAGVPSLEKSSSMLSGGVEEAEKMFDALITPQNKANATAVTGGVRKSRPSRLDTLSSEVSSSEFNADTMFQDVESVAQSPAGRSVSPCSLSTSYNLTPTNTATPSSGIRLSKQLPTQNTSLSPSLTNSSTSSSASNVPLGSSLSGVGSLASTSLSGHKEGPKESENELVQGEEDDIFKDLHSPTSQMFTNIIVETPSANITSPAFNLPTPVSLSAFEIETPMSAATRSTRDMDAMFDGIEPTPKGNAGTRSLSEAGCMFDDLAQQSSEEYAAVMGSTCGGTEAAAHGDETDAGLDDMFENIEDDELRFEKSRLESSESDTESESNSSSACGSNRETL